MADPADKRVDKYGGIIGFKEMMAQYIKRQEKVVNLMSSLGGTSSQIQPGKFIMLQFAMSQVAQIGQSVSNVVSTITSVISNAVRNLKTQ